MYLNAQLALCFAVCQPYEGNSDLLPASGINELIYGIMESLVDEQVHTT
ncbi:unnamed protein product, partial [Rotaria socialis]